MSASTETNFYASWILNYAMTAATPWTAAATKLKRFKGETIPESMLSKLLALVEANVRSYYGPHWDYDAKRSELTHPDMLILLICYGNCIHAAAAYRICSEESVRVAYLYELQVAKQARSSGLGSMLLKHVERSAKEENAKGIMLTVHSNNTDARKFYAKRSFQVSPVSPSLCAPPATNRGNKYELMQYIWDTAAANRLRQRGKDAKEFLWRQALSDGSLRIKLKMRTRLKRASDSADLTSWAPARKKRTS